MALKIYRSLVYPIWVTSVIVDGKSVPVSFEGGMISPFKRYGTFGTSDPKLQEAIENHPLFGEEIAIDSIDGIPYLEYVRMKQEPPTPEDKPNPEEDKPNPEEVDGTPEEVMENMVKEEKSVEEHPEITTVAEAREFLLIHYNDVKQKDVLTKASIRQVAERKGLSFPNL